MKENPVPASRSKFSQLVVASHNRGKITEIEDLLRPLGIKVQNAAALCLPDVEETGSSFEDNAILKAVDVAKRSGLPALGDDSGLMVDALDGAPGIHTARWAQRNGAARNWDYAMGQVAAKLQDIGAQNWSAQFVCVLALAQPDGQVVLTRGEVAGKLIWPVRGQQGFGFDPMFVPDGHELTFAQMPAAQKHAISHRHHAFAAMLRQHLS
ncbi:Nucleoside 5-triphosphatase RdgB (dHAPTP, dITP, XTP-specific) [hydrothermal vent metagenome]|uniref:dITP/XTP pyrophosphatase n=1 Tax=hydrothermal vent metagenome TaxID=652676 RepID=A0A3B0S752_9ZZZZ